MRVPPLWFTIRRMMIAIAVVGVGAAALVLYQRNTTYYASGWWEAGRELWRGEATIYDFDGGYTSTVGDFCCFDRDTGLPIHGVGWSYGMQRGGCERVHGHNDRIAQYIRWHGLPKNTLKPWEKELFNLANFFDDRSRSIVPRKLFAGGPAAVSPHGKTSVRLVADVHNDGTPTDWVGVIITVGNVVFNDGYILSAKREYDVLWGPEMVPDKRVPVRAISDKADYDLLWGPKGAPFVVIRSVFNTREHFKAYDLRTGRLLRDETWNEGKHYGGRFE
jgi:hypothetical protein